MNYRLRDVVNGLFSPNAWDAKGFADSGHSLTPSQAASRLLSQQEDYAPGTYASLMNLIDSHDTARALWVMTPGTSDTAAKEQNRRRRSPSGKQRLKLAALLQYTIPGAPTVYYGDEVGVTGGDDPDNRRTYPWADPGGHPNNALLAYYTSLGHLGTPCSRSRTATSGCCSPTTRRACSSTAARRASRPRSCCLTAAAHHRPSRPGGQLPARGHRAYARLWQRLADERLPGEPSPRRSRRARAVVLETGLIDLKPPSAPTGLAAAPSSGAVALTWGAVPSGRAIRRLPEPGHRWRLRQDQHLARHGDVLHGHGTAERRARRTTSCRAFDATGNRSALLERGGGTPHLTIGWSNIQWPPTLTHTISAVNRTNTVYGQVWINGVTNQPGQTPTLRAQLGWGPDGSNPGGSASWPWVDATFNTDAGSNDEFVASLLPDQVGSFDYAYRYTTTDGESWVYADFDGTTNGYDPAQAGLLTVNASGDSTAPAIPTGLHVVAADRWLYHAGWDAVTGDPTMYGYEIGRGTSAGRPCATLAFTRHVLRRHDRRPTATYYYVVRAVDTSFNRSADSAPVEGKAALRNVTVTVNVTVPASTDGTGRAVHIAGTLSVLDRPGPDWDPTATALTRVDATHWTITLHGVETTQLQYKYALGDWNYVEKDAGCGEVGNRLLTLSYGSSGTQTVNDTVINWRNVAPCGS